MDKKIPKKLTFKKKETVKPKEPEVVQKQEEERPNKKILFKKQEPEIKKEDVYISPIDKIKNILTNNDLLLKYGNKKYKSETAIKASITKFTNFYTEKRKQEKIKFKNDVLKPSIDNLNVLLTNTKDTLKQENKKRGKNINGILKTNLKQRVKELTDQKKIKDKEDLKLTKDINKFNEIQNNKIQYEKNKKIYDNNIKKKTYIEKLGDQLRNLRITGEDVVIKTNDFQTIWADDVDIKQFTKFFIELLTQYLTGNVENYIIEIDNIYRYLNEANLKKLEEVIENNLNGVEIITTGNTYSDYQFVVNMWEVETIFIKRYIPNKNRDNIINELLNNKKVREEGAYFKYINLTKYSLERYGIYKKYNKNNYNENCLYDAFKLLGMDENKLNELKYFVKNRNIPKADLKDVADKLNIKIHLKSEQDDNNLRKYGTNDIELYNICLIDGHYFINEKTNITNYSIENYNTICDMVKFNEIYFYNNIKNKYVRSSDRGLMSFDVISIMLKNKDIFFKKYDNSHLYEAGIQFYENMDSINNSLDWGPVENKTYTNIKHKNEDTEEKINYFFDVETHTIERETNGIIEYIHEPYLVNVRNETINKTFYGEKCGLDMLYYITDNEKNKVITLIAHNAGYDYNYIVEHITITNEILRGNFLIMSRGIFNKKTLIIKDSYALISNPLRDFVKIFGIEGIKKEIMPYGLYNEKDIIKKQYVSIKYVVDTYLKDYEKEHFINNIKEWGCDNNNNEYDIIKYSKKYCELDTLILMNGYNTFKQWMKELLHIDIDSCLTITGITKKYITNNGAYDGCCEISGIPQKFINKNVVGGRVMCNNNEKQHITEDIEAYDAKSLYASAIYFSKGFLKGLPKVIQNIDLNIDKLNTYDGFFIEIKIKKINKKLSYPLMSIKDKEGVRQFTNDMLNKKIVVNKIDMEELIKYHDIEYEIIRGYYFDDGFNDKIIKLVKFLYDMRQQYKKQNNKCEFIFKTMLCSIYGSNLIKEHLTEVKFFNDIDKFDTYVMNNYNHIKQSSKIRNSGKIRCEVYKKTNTHFNTVHIGCEILSNSKKLMNNVFSICNDNEVPVHYQDTDSLYLNKKDIKIISDEFIKRHERDFIGEQMGQFGPDLTLSYYVISKAKLLDASVRTDVNENDKTKAEFLNYEEIKCKNVYATEGIFLGKKSYLNILSGDGKNNEKIEGYKTRLKGITDGAIIHKCKKEDINKQELFYNLYVKKKEEKITFDLAEGGSRPCFRRDGRYGTKTIKEFNRSI